jgi:hypothetical protein
MSVGTTHRTTLNPSRHPRTVFFWVGLFLWCLANQLWRWILDYRRSSLGNKAARSVGTSGVCFEYTTKRKGSADTTHRATLNPSRHPAGLYFFGWVCFSGSSSGRANTTQRHRFLGGFVFLAFGEPSVGVSF